MSFKTSIYKLTIRQSVIFKQKGFQWRHRKHHDVRVPGHFGPKTDLFQTIPMNRS